MPAAWWRSPATSCSRPASSRRAWRTARRRADLLRLQDGGEWHHPRAAAREQRDRLHAADPARRPAARLDTTRSAAALDLWLDRLGGVARRHRQCADRLVPSSGADRQGAPKPAAIVGMPVGFVGAAESKEALAATAACPSPSSGPQGRQRHAAAAVNASARPSDERAGKGRFIGVGMGPGDPELLSLKAARILNEADVIAYFAKRGTSATRRAIVDEQLKPEIVELSALLYPFTTEIDKDRPLLSRRWSHFYDQRRMRGRRELRLAGRRGDVRRRSLLLRLLHASA